jgi:hypothetical protein
MDVIELPHKVLDYACPINGLEDQYEWKTKTRLTGFVLMDLGTIGFTYIKQKNAPAPRMVFWGSGMGRQLFNSLADVVGFEWTCLEDKAFRTAWQTARDSVNNGTPVLLGLLDMYYLHYYPKFYHRIHIPLHYVLMVGYDEQKEAALVQDTGLPGVQSIPLSDLQPAWNVRNPGLGKPNTLFTFKFSDQPATLESIWRRGLKKRAATFLNPAVGFLGIRGMRKLQKEIAGWPNELDDAAWKESMHSLVTFTSSVVPNLPQSMLPFPLGYTDPHQACRDRFADELAGAAKEYHEPGWAQAADLFRKSGEKIGRLTDLSVAALSGKKGLFDEASGITGQIADFEEAAFKLLV